MLNKKCAKIFCLILIVFSLPLFFYYFFRHSNEVSFTKTSFTALPAWQADNHSETLIAFKKSCVEISKRDPNHFFGSRAVMGKVSDWQTICASAMQNPDKLTAKEFFEYWFEPYLVRDHARSQGMFTGYYLPTLSARLKKENDYAIPIYGMPADLIKIDLGLFREELKGKMLIGQLKNGRITPYPDRAAIQRDDRQMPVLAWSNNLAEVFFAQIQGSVLLKFPDGQLLLLGYAGKNGKPYISIGKILVRTKALPLQSVSMQSIHAWLKTHPDQVENILNQNPSYVFFKKLAGSDPLGTEQIPLTPARSLAVDTQYIPLGVPLWLDTTVPDMQEATLNVPFQHLLIAQDTGGDITGAIRGDIYWGAGDQAAHLAGHMKSKGQYWLLLPRRL